MGKITAAGVASAQKQNRRSSGVASFFGFEIIKPILMAGVHLANQSFRVFVVEKQMNITHERCGFVVMAGLARFWMCGSRTDLGGGEIPLISGKFVL